MKAIEEMTIEELRGVFKDFNKDQLLLSMQTREQKVKQLLEELEWTQSCLNRLAVLYNERQSCHIA